MKGADYDPHGVEQYSALTTSNPVRRRWHRNKLQLLRFVGVSREDQILDAGCGAGNLVFEVAPFCRLVVGCDADPARLSVGAQGRRGVYVRADIQHLSFADEAFDLIACMEVLEHLDQRITPQVLNEFHRLLKPQGKLLITTPNYHSLWVLIEFLADTLRLAPGMVGGEHISKYHQRTLADALSAAGFVIKTLGTFNHLSPFVALLSDRWAESLYHRELTMHWPGGNLLYALCEKP
jgi:2-polyprenyl-3-methyl-5-hydroxy-6-metoxy-1,4-benzoquinol methylase